MASGALSWTRCVLFGVDFYFVYPHASWECGTNKNANGLIREDFPGICDFATIIPLQLARAAHQLNH